MMITHRRLGVCFIETTLTWQFQTLPVTFIDVYGSIIGVNFDDVPHISEWFLSVWRSIKSNSNEYFPQIS